MSTRSEAQVTGLEHPVLFVAQFPIAADFATIGSTFANHFPSLSSAGRGGDLYLLFPDGELCNVTRQAGFGDATVRQGAGAISVRDPAAHWNGQRALFSMVVGAPEQQFQQGVWHWQIYEASGLTSCSSVAVSRVANQPESYNNISPIYSPDGRIVFTSDRPRSGQPHHYPQHDEYESTPTNTGLWSLDPLSGDLHLLSHDPSGAFSPLVDSFGRILFTRWDHLQRDQQADGPGNPNGAFDWADESAGAATLPPQEVFPEPRLEVAGSNVNGLRFNHFFPWEIRPDGTGMETINHVGRHELHNYFNRSFSDDPNLVEFIASVSGRINPNSALNLFQLSEHPSQAGTYLAVDAPEFQTHASGRILRFSAPPGLAPDQMVLADVTHPDTGTVVGDGTPPPSTHSGHYRDPLQLSDGRVLAAHTAETRAAGNEGSTAAPQPRYDFRLKVLEADGSYQSAGTPLLAAPLVREIEYWNPDVLVRYNGPLWELQPTELRPRPAPPLLESAPLQSPEAQIFAEEGVVPSDFQADLANRGLALVVSRDITRRDQLDRQQPFNLRVPGGVQTAPNGGQVYDVAYMQFFQGDQVRGLGGTTNPRPGRRVLARVMHDPAVRNPPNAGPPGSVSLGTDGSMAALVPTRRALSWQLTDPAGEPVVRERYWLSFQPGEIRVCASCHGLSSVDQAGQGEPENAPEALRELLRFWQAELLGRIFADDFESGLTDSWSGP